MKLRMSISDVGKPSPQTLPEYDRAKELKAFDETKAGVKGLVDTGIVNIPRIFIRPPEELAQEHDQLTPQQTSFEVPVVDLDGVKDNSKLEEIVGQIRTAATTWGFFQVVNHGIPSNILANILEGIRKFNEQDVEVKKEFYIRDPKRSVRFNTNFHLYLSRTANWRDTLTISTFGSGNLDPSDLPEVCRDTIMEYRKNAIQLGHTLFELLSMALGLKPNHLQEMGCTEGCNVSCHYYPPCPEPELTLGATRHSDPGFITILLQDQIGGLQVFHENQWVDVEPISGGLVINIGDFLQVVSNGKFRSVDHRVVSRGVGPRLSVACFLTGHATANPKLYGPIKQLISEENPPIYRDFLVSEYFNIFSLRGLDDERTALDGFKL